MSARHGVDPQQRVPAATPTAVRCPLCGSSSTPAFVVGDRNRASSTELFNYNRCGRCESYFIVDVPDDLGRYYPESYYALPTVEQLDAAAASEAHRVELLRRHVAPGPLVEIGAGFGVFARAARNAGFDVTAIEMDARCCEYLDAVVGVRAVNSASPSDVLSRLAPSRAVALWHSLEHLPRPWEVLECAAANLEPGGVLAVAMPNPQALQFRLLGARWAHVDAPRHLFLIPAAALTAKAAVLGLRRVGLTTGDPSARHWNRFGWEYALRRGPPSVRPSTRMTEMLSLLIAVGLRPIEARACNGSAYTALFVKQQGAT